MRPAGLTASNRAVLSQLRRSFPGPFTAPEAASEAGLDLDRARRLLRHLEAQGWLVRIRRGLYSAVPLEAENPRDWHPDPWVVAASAWPPGYVGGWTALHHWDLTDQLFSTVAFVTAARVSRRQVELGGARFELRHRDENKLFGTKRVWRDRVPVEVSNPERTLVDCLDDTSFGAGVDHVGGALQEWSRGAAPDLPRLVSYGDALGNRTVFKRLGYLAERFDLGAELVEASRARISKGVSQLDSTRPAAGPIVSRWNLQINAGTGS